MNDLAGTRTREIRPSGSYVDEAELSTSLIFLLEARDLKLNLTIVLLCIMAIGLTCISRGLLVINCSYEGI